MHYMIEYFKCHHNHVGERNPSSIGAFILSIFVHPEFYAFKTEEKFLPPSISQIVTSKNLMMLFSNLLLEP